MKHKKVFGPASSVRRTVAISVAILIWAVSLSASAQVGFGAQDVADTLREQDSTAPVYTEVRYEHFQRAMGSGKRFGVARAIPGIKAELVRCEDREVFAGPVFADENGLIEFGDVTPQEAQDIQNLPAGDLCMRLYGESRLNANRAATRTMVTYGSTLVGWERRCDSNDRIAGVCTTTGRFREEFEPRVEDIAECARDVAAAVEGADAYPPACPAGRVNEPTQGLDWESAVAQLGQGGVGQIYHDSYNAWLEAESFSDSLVIAVEDAWEQTNEFAALTMADYEHQVQVLEAYGESLVDTLGETKRCIKRCEWWETAWCVPTCLVLGTLDALKNTIKVTFESISFLTRIVTGLGALAVTWMNSLVLRAPAAVLLWIGEEVGVGLGWEGASEFAAMIWGVIDTSLTLSEAIVQASATYADLQTHGSVTAVIEFVETAPKVAEFISNAMVVGAMIPMPVSLTMALDAGTDPSDCTWEGTEETWYCRGSAYLVDALMAMPIYLSLVNTMTLLDEIFRTGTFTPVRRQHVFDVPVNRVVQDNNGNLQIGIPILSPANDASAAGDPAEIHHTIGWYVADILYRTQRARMALGYADDSTITLFETQEKWGDGVEVVWPSRGCGGEASCYLRTDLDYVREPTCFDASDCSFGEACIDSDVTVGGYCESAANLERIPGSTGREVFLRGRSGYLANVLNSDGMNRYEVTHEFGHYVLDVLGGFGTPTRNQASALGLLRGGHSQCGLDGGERDTIMNAEFSFQEGFADWVAMLGDGPLNSYVRYHPLVSESEFANGQAPDVPFQVFAWQTAGAPPFRLPWAPDPAAPPPYDRDADGVPDADEDPGATGAGATWALMAGREVPVMDSGLADTDGDDFEDGLELWLGMDPNTADVPDPNRFGGKVRGGLSSHYQRGNLANDSDFDTDECVVRGHREEARIGSLMWNLHDDFEVPHRNEWYEHPCRPSHNSIDCAVGYECFPTRPAGDDRPEPALIHSRAYPVGSAADHASGVCLPRQNGCATNSDCAPLEACDGGECVRACTSDLDCLGEVNGVLSGIARCVGPNGELGSTVPLDDRRCGLVQGNIPAGCDDFPMCTGGTHCYDGDNSRACQRGILDLHEVIAAVADDVGTGLVAGSFIPIIPATDGASPPQNVCELKTRLEKQIDDNVSGESLEATLRQLRMMYTYHTIDPDCDPDGEWAFEEEDGLENGEIEAEQARARSQALSYSESASAGSDHVAGEDVDQDGKIDGLDGCPYDYDPDNEIWDISACDIDGDGIRNRLDNCAENWNPDQLDCDQDGDGNVCDPSPNYAECSYLMAENHVLNMQLFRDEYMEFDPADLQWEIAVDLFDREGRLVEGSPLTAQCEEQANWQPLQPDDLSHDVAGQLVLASRDGELNGFSSALELTTSGPEPMWLGDHQYRVTLPDQQVLCSPVLRGYGQGWNHSLAEVGPGSVIPVGDMYLYLSHPTDSSGAGVVEVFLGRAGSALLKQLPVTFPELGVRSKFLGRYRATPNNPQQMGEVFVYGGIVDEAVVRDVWRFSVGRRIGDLSGMTRLTTSEAIEGVDPDAVDPVFVGFPSDDKFIQMATRIEGQMFSEVVSLEDGSRAEMELAQPFDMRKSYTLHPEVCGGSPGGVSVTDPSTCPHATPSCSTVDGWQRCECPGTGHDASNPPACVTDIDCDLPGQSSFQECDQSVGSCVVSVDVKGDGSYCPTDVSCTGASVDVCLTAATQAFQTAAGVTFTQTFGQQSHFPPETIRGTSSFYVESFRTVLMFGGLLNDGTHDNSLHRFHPFEGYFKEVIPATSLRPPGRSLSALGWDEVTQTLYVAAGWDDQQLFDDVWMIQPFVESPVWQQFQSAGQLPTPRTGGAVLVWGNGTFDVVGHDGASATELANDPSDGADGWLSPSCGQEWSFQTEFVGMAATYSSILLVNGDRLSSRYWSDGTEIDSEPTSGQGAYSHGQVVYRTVDELLFWHSGDDQLMRGRLTPRGELDDVQYYTLPVSMNRANVELGPGELLYLSDTDHLVEVDAPYGADASSFASQVLRSYSNAAANDISFVPSSRLLHHFVESEVVTVSVDQSGNQTAVAGLSGVFRGIRGFGELLYTTGPGGNVIYGLIDSTYVSLGTHDRAKWVNRQRDATSRYRAEYYEDDLSLRISSCF